jgi:hypothetical protein
LRATNGGFVTRQPPPSVVGFVKDKAALPRIADVHLQIVRLRRTE